MNQNRVHRGQREGGQFTERAFGEATITLDRPDTAVFLREAVGYTYRAELYSIKEIAGRMRSDLPDATTPLTGDHADYLSNLANELDIDVSDPYSYDTDDFPKPIFEDQVTIAEHPLLEREYWDTPGYDSEPSTAEDALEKWVETFDDNTPGLKDALLNGTVWNAPAEQNLRTIAANANDIGVDLEDIGYPLPIRHN